MQNEYLDCISAETHAAFDTFAETIQVADILAVNKPTVQPERCMDDQYLTTLKHWGAKGLTNVSPDTVASAKDITAITLLTVLKKRGLSISALKQVKQIMDWAMYDNVSMLDFAVLLCQKINLGQVDRASIPYLVIDGDNRVCLARASDISAIVTSCATATFSHLLVNLNRVFNDCAFVYKICTANIMEMVELSPKITAKLYSPVVKSVSIDLANGRLESVMEDGPEPDYGEIIIKRQNGKNVCVLTKRLEKLDD